MSTTHHHQEKGTNVTHQKRSTKTPSTSTGLFATLRGALHPKGSDAPTHHPVLIARHLVLSVALAMIGTLAITATPALAEITHKYEGQITGPSAGAFSNPWGLAFDGSGDLFVADAGEARVDVFDQSNAPVTQIGLGVLTGAYNRSVAVSDSTVPLARMKSDSRRK